MYYSEKGRGKHGFGGSRGVEGVSGKGMCVRGGCGADTSVRPYTVLPNGADTSVRPYAVLDYGAGPSVGPDKCLPRGAGPWGRPDKNVDYGLVEEPFCWALRNSSALNSFRKILPTMVLGKDSRISTALGTL